MWHGLSIRRSFTVASAVTSLSVEKRVETEKAKLYAQEMGAH
jgi:hypothetical protein